MTHSHTPDLYRAKRLLCHAIDHLRPLAQGDTLKDIQPNAEALAISTLAKSLVDTVRAPLCSHCGSVLSVVTWQCVRGQYCPGVKS